jgi:DNA (cytosine-5)-methyltransferase 1
VRVLDLFSGIGGFSLGLERAGMTTVAFCEIEPYLQGELKRNFPGVPIYDDVRTVTADRLRADGITGIDLVCGGFPCQPFSCAGKQLGTLDDRHLWPEMFRIIQELRPTWVIGENVAGFIGMALDDVCDDLADAGYETQPIVIPACAVESRQRRDRVWILSHAVQGNKELGRDISRGGRFAKQVSRHPPCQQESEPPMVALVDGIPPWMAALQGYGNSVHPRIPEIIGKTIMSIHNQAIA